MKHFGVLFCLILLISELGAIETGNRFTLLGLLEEDSRVLGAQWALDLRHQQSLARINTQVGYSMHAQLQNHWDDGHSLNMDAQTYRWWLSLQLPRSEARIGLQQINFGSAQILRPLQWFDSLQAQDPYQISRGVEALLLRHYWLNNANLWLWGLPGSGDLKGMEFLPGKKDSAELGGRIQYPLSIGEGAVNAHYRKLQAGEEFRAGFDLRYDGIIGAWLEASGSHFSKSSGFQPAYLASATLGMDYVLNYGNGIALTLETLVAGSAKAELEQARYRGASSAALFSYPLGLLDSVSLLGYADWESRSWAVNWVWRRVYDYTSLDLSIGKTDLMDYRIQAMININL